MAKRDLKYAGDFNFERCDLITTTGDTLDVTQLVENIKIYENIFTETISGSITLKDTTNILQNGPVVGQERLVLKLSTPQTSPTQDTIIDFTKQPLDVYKINLQYGTNEAATMINLAFTSQETYRNFTTRVSQSYKGQPSEIVRKILRDNNYLKSSTRFFYEETANNVKIVSPNLQPFDLIQDISLRSNSKQHQASPSYLFFQTTKGFHFRSVDGMCSREPIFYYKENIPNQLTEQGTIDPAKNMMTINGFEVVSTTDIIDQLDQGKLNSKLIVHDWHKKSLKKHLYDYIDMYNNDTHLEAHPLVSQSLHKTEEGRLYVTSTSGGTAFSETDGYPYESDQKDINLQRNESRVNQVVSGITLNLNVPGNTTLQAGDVIDVAMKSSSTMSGGGKDGKLAGRYLVKSIAHDFQVSGEGKHTMLLQVTKDGLSSPIPSVGTGEQRNDTSEDISV